MLRPRYFLHLQWQMKTISGRSATKLMFALSAFPCPGSGYVRWIILAFDRGLKACRLLPGMSSDCCRRQHSSALAQDRTGWTPAHSWEKW